MIEILEHLQQLYVPTKVVDLETPIPDCDSTHDTRFITTLLGGDYLSVARARGAQFIRSNAELNSQTLNGFLPVAEDWHVKVCFMNVSMVFLS